MYNEHIIKKRSATNTSPCSLYRQDDGWLRYFFCEPSFFLLLRGVVFLFSSTFFRKKFALTSRAQSPSELLVRSQEKFPVFSPLSSCQANDHELGTIAPILLNSLFNSKYIHILSLSSYLTTYQSSKNIGEWQARELARSDLKVPLSVYRYWLSGISHKWCFSSNNLVWFIYCFIGSGWI